MKRLTPNEMLEYVAECLAEAPYYNSRNAKFRPDDVCPHSPSFKYKCAKLYKLGMLVRGRWHGYVGY